MSPGALHHPPRALRAAGSLRRRAQTLALRGDGVECPCCGARLRHFARFNGREGALCPACMALERHRALWLFLRQRWGGRNAPGRVLHFAPEPSLERNLRAMGIGDYVTADLAEKADLRLDICDTGLAGESFDAIICSHVLEHVADDRRAMREMLRLLRPGAEAIVLVPMDGRLPATDEDPAVSDPAERERRFGQHDHLRRYGADFPARLAESGFEVTVGHARASEAERARFGLREADPIFLSRRPAPSAG